MSKSAESRFPVHELIGERWSPYSFSDRAVAAEDIGSLLAAARWAASSYNEQPWAFLVCTKDDSDGFERLASCLVPANRAWAERAPVLILSVARLTFSRNGKPNRHALHDVGLAVGNLCAQAQSRGLSVHQMAGFDVEKARASFSIPDDCEPVAVMAIGYRGEASDLPSEMQARDTSERQRKPWADNVFGAGWGSRWL